MQAIHSSLVLGWIEQPNVSLVHAQAGEPSIGGTFSEDSAAVGVKFNCSDGGVAEDEVTKKSPTGAGEEM